MKKHSAYTLMLVGLVLIISALAACGTSKKVSRFRSIVQTSDSVTTGNQVEVIAEVTKNYGDSLKGAAFVPVAGKLDAGLPSNTPKGKGTKLFTVESKGIKLKMQHTPVYNDAGLLTGIDIDYEAIAKANAITDKQTLKAGEQNQATRKKSEARQEDQTEKKSEFQFGWVIWLVILCLFIASIFFHRNLIKIFDK
jgi:hypothetical protein